MVAPIIDELAGEYEGRVTIGKRDVDSNNAIAVQYAVRPNIPTILFIKNGQIVDKQIGAAPKNVFAEENRENLCKLVFCFHGDRGATSPYRLFCVAISYPPNVLLP